MVEFFFDRLQKKTTQQQLEICSGLCIPIFFRVGLLFLFVRFIAFAWFKEKIMHSTIKGLTKLIKERREKKLRIVH